MYGPKVEKLGFGLVRTRSQVNKMSRGGSYDENYTIFPIGSMYGISTYILYTIKINQM